MAVLIYKESGGRYVAHQVPFTKFTIGRSMEADLIIKDERISRVHWEIQRAMGGFVIRDLGSRNGTWVNDQRVEEQKLKFGDRIRLGNTIITFDS